LPLRAPGGEGRACFYSAASGSSTASTELSVTQAVWKYLI
jgi:hypothetical protein